MKTMHGAFASACCEQVAHARGADADEHLDELRAAQAEERHVRLAGDRARQQRLAGARRPDQQHALRDAAAEVRGTSSGVLRNSTISFSSSSASSTPATSAKRHLHVVFGVDLRRLLRANDMTPPSAPPMRRKKKPEMPMKKRAAASSRAGRAASGSAVSPVYFTWCCFEFLDQLRVLDPVVVNVRELSARRLVGPSACRGSVWSPIVTSATLSVGDERLELAVRNRRGRPGAKKYTCTSREQQQEAEDVPDGRQAGSAGPSGRRSPGRPPRGFGARGCCVACQVRLQWARPAVSAESASPPASRNASAAACPLLEPQPVGARVTTTGRLRGSRPGARASPADRARGAGSSASAAARRRPDRTPRRPAAPSRRSVSSHVDLPLLEPLHQAARAGCRRSASCAPGRAGGRRRSRRSGSGTPAGSARAARPSPGAACPRRAPAVARAARSAMYWLPTFDVMMTTVFLKSTVRPWPSVRRPSSSICSRTLNTSGCAFSISSNSTTE